jgi:hypothetical protein
MTGIQDKTAIEIDGDGRLLAEADVEPADASGLVHVSMSVAGGPVPGGTGARLVDAVLDLPEVDKADRLLATMPLGDTEMIDRVRERSEVVETRAAGATKLVEARLRPAHR